MKGAHTMISIGSLYYYKEYMSYLRDAFWQQTKSEKFFPLLYGDIQAKMIRAYQLAVCKKTNELSVKTSPSFT